MTRRYARAPIGERACGEAPVRWKRLTVLGALSLDGVVTMTTVTTGTTIPVFVDFLQTTLLPGLREQKPDAIVVMDNLSAHKNQAVKDAIAAAGLTVRYLPRYSPDFSPIEPCWSKIKTALRAVAARTVESLRAALDTAAADVTAEDAAGWFGAVTPRQAELSLRPHFHGTAPSRLPPGSLIAPCTRRRSNQSKPRNWANGSPRGGLYLSSGASSLISSKREHPITLFHAQPALMTRITPEPIPGTSNLSAETLTGMKSSILDLLHQVVGADAVDAVYIVKAVTRRI